MEECKSCNTCKHLYNDGWGGMCDILDYQSSINTDPLFDYANSCNNYKYYNWKEEEYTPSATAGDYSPSCPWNAPGMRVSDFL